MRISITHEFTEAEYADAQHRNKSRPDATRLEYDDAGATPVRLAGDGEDQIVALVNAALTALHHVVAVRTGVR